MTTKIAIILLAAGSLPLMAAQATLQLSSTLPDGAISPYTGIINGVTQSSPDLYCDDVNDGANYNSYQVEINPISAAGSGVTRFTTEASWALGQQGLSQSPTVTNLYDEAAWLFSQIAGNASQATAIQEAAWLLMTNATSVPNWSSLGDPENTASADWLKLAASDYSADTAHGSVTADGVTATLSTTNYSDWFVADACTVNGQGVCTGLAGTNDSAGQTWQEFLIYSNGGLNPGGGSVSGTPEPATFGLLGGALLFGGFFARRRKSSK